MEERKALSPWGVGEERRTGRVRVMVELRLPPPAWEGKEAWEGGREEAGRETKRLLSARGVGRWWPLRWGVEAAAPSAAVPTFFFSGGWTTEGSTGGLTAGSSMGVWRRSRWPPQRPVW